MAGAIKLQVNNGTPFDLLPENGRYLYRFRPTSPSDTLTLLNTSQGQIKLDNILTHLMLKHGTEPGEYVPNESQASQVQQVWQNFQELQRSMEDRERGLQVLIRETASGILEKFIDSKGNLLTDRATIAGKIMERVKSDTEESVRQQLPGLISSEVVSGSVKSIIQQSGSQIVNALAGKTGELITQLNLAPEGAYIKGKRIVLDGETHLTTAFANKLMTESLEAQTVKSFVGKFNRVIANEIISDSINAGIIRASVLEADSLRAYRGFIGGFRLGDHPHGGGNWLTGENQFSIGMSDGRGGPKRTALWVNWGTDWNEPAWGAWWITHDGVMHVKNTPIFYRNINIAGELLGADGVKRANYAVTSEANGQNYRVDEIVWRNQEGGGSQVGFRTGSHTMWLDVDKVN